MHCHKNLSSEVGGYQGTKKLGMAAQRPQELRELNLELIRRSQEDNGMLGNKCTYTHTTHIQQLCGQQMPKFNFFHSQLNHIPFPSPLIGPSRCLGSISPLGHTFYRVLLIYVFILVISYISHYILVIRDNDSVMLKFERQWIFRVEVIDESVSWVMLWVVSPSKKTLSRRSYPCSIPHKYCICLPNQYYFFF